MHSRTACVNNDNHKSNKTAQFVYQSQYKLKTEKNEIESPPQ